MANPGVPPPRPAAGNQAAAGAPTLKSTRTGDAQSHRANQSTMRSCDGGAGEAATTGGVSASRVRTPSHRNANPHTKPWARSARLSGAWRAAPTSARTTCTSRAPKMPHREARLTPSAPRHRPGVSGSVLLSSVPIEFSVSQKRRSGPGHVAALRLGECPPRGSPPRARDVAHNSQVIRGAAPAGTLHTNPGNPVRTPPSSRRP